MRVIVAGTRTFQDREKIYAVLDYLHSLYSFSCVISGLAPGPDTLGKEWAESRGILVECCAADWEKYHNTAGIIRNSQMANEADYLIAFMTYPSSIVNVSMSACQKKPDGLIEKLLDFSD